MLIGAEGDGAGAEGFWAWVWRIRVMVRRRETSGVEEDIVIGMVEGDGNGGFYGIRDVGL